MCDGKIYGLVARQIESFLKSQGMWIDYFFQMQLVILDT
jgi:hypothetical protein